MDADDYADETQIDANWITDYTDQYGGKSKCFSIFIRLIRKIRDPFLSRSLRSI